MTVQELIKILETIPNKFQDVYLSSDAEGNRYSPLVDIEHNCIRTEEGDIYPADEDIEYSNVVCVLWP